MWWGEELWEKGNENSWVDLRLWELALNGNKFCFGFKGTCLLDTSATVHVLILSWRKEKLFWEPPCQKIQGSCTPLQKPVVFLLKFISNYPNISEWHWWQSRDCIELQFTNRSSFANMKIALTKELCPVHYNQGGAVAETRADLGSSTHHSGHWNIKTSLVLSAAGCL